MKLFYDSNKNIKNIEERDLNFERVLEFDFSAAKFWQDERKTYSEARYVALGYLDKRLHVLCFGDAVGGIRVIRFRRANQRVGVKHGFPLTRD